MKEDYFITYMMTDKAEPGAVIHFTYRVKSKSLRDAVDMSKGIESKIVEATNLNPYKQCTGASPFRGYEIKDYPAVKPKDGKVTVMMNKAGRVQKQVKLELA